MIYFSGPITRDSSWKLAGEASLSISDLTDKLASCLEGSLNVLVIEDVFSEEEASNDFISIKQQGVEKSLSLTRLTFINSSQSSKYQLSFIPDLRGLGGIMQSEMGVKQEGSAFTELLLLILTENHGKLEKLGIETPQKLDAFLLNTLLVP